MSPIPGHDLHLALKDIKYKNILKMIDSEIGKINEDIQKYLEDIQRVLNYGT